VNVQLKCFYLVVLCMLSFQRYVDPEVSEELYQLSVSDAGDYKVCVRMCVVLCMC